MREPQSKEFNCPLSQVPIYVLRMIANGDVATDDGSDLHFISMLAAIYLREKQQ